MDIVIPLGSGSTWFNNELRYALRSIDRYLQDAGTVYIIGEKPEWLTNVVHIPFKEIALFVHKEKNICDKVLAACKLIDGDFLFMNDDHFLLQPVERMPYYHGGTLLCRLEACGDSNPYAKTVINGIKLLGANAWNFDIHCPVIFNSKSYAQVMSEVDWTVPYGYMMKSIYCNRMKVPGIYTVDLKINTALSKEDIAATIKGRSYFSIGDAGLNDAMKATLKELYPQPSRWEFVGKISK